MCGIAGIIGAEDLDQAEQQARRMIQSIAHRGPDGVRIERVGNAVLAHARLSIIDLEGGWQPLHAAGGTVIGNGEIYNYLELIETFGLEEKLTTGSDFEPLLHLYAQEGERAFERLRGMYAFCLIGGDGRTWLVRDRFGIKPLYVLQNQPALLFSSEPRAIPMDRRAQVSAETASELLTLNYTVDAQSLYLPMERIAPGAVHQVVGGGLVPQGVLQPPFASPAIGGEDDQIRALDRVLENSVMVHQRSDVPYGLFLSGGVDSTAIATLMSRLNARPVVAYTCGWDTDQAHDERSSAEKIARALNLDWRETIFSEEDFWRIAPKVAWALDDPTSDFACLPTYKLAEAAKGALKVVLSGEGGDELFAGYGRYRRALRPTWFGGRAAEPQIDAAFLQDRGSGALHRWRQAAREGGGGGGLRGAQLADMATWLPDDLLLKLDRCLMAHGLEGRTPFLDREVAAFAGALPDRMKVRGRYGKWILRMWLKRYCPAAEPWARKKGFTVPVASFIAPRATDLADPLAGHEGLRGVCDPDAVRAVFTEPEQANNRWPILFYALWWSIHVGGATPEDALAALLT